MTLSPSIRNTLYRDGYVCQACGEITVLSAVPLTPLTTEEWEFEHSVALCGSCELAFENGNPHAVAYEHLINEGRTVTKGYPYLGAQVRAVTHPMHPLPSLTAFQSKLLALLAETTDSVAVTTLLSNFRDVTPAYIRQQLAVLVKHAFIVFTPNGRRVARFDLYNPPPLLPGARPLADTPEGLAYHVKHHAPMLDWPRMMLIGLTDHAGESMSRRQLRVLLASRLPNKLAASSAYILIDVLERGQVIASAKPSGYEFSRTLRHYTNVGLYNDLRFMEGNPTQIWRLKTGVPAEEQWRNRYVPSNRAALAKRRKEDAAKAAAQEGEEPQPTRKPQARTASKQHPN